MKLLLNITIIIIITISTTCYSFNFFNFSQTETLIKNAVPLRWVNDNTILIAIGNEIAEFNVGKKIKTRTVYKIDSSYGELNPNQSCFTKNRWILILNKKEKYSIGFKTLDVRLASPTKFDVSEDMYWGDINRIDCTLKNERPKNMTRGQISFNHQTYQLNTNNKKLVKQADGQANIYKLSSALLANVKTLTNQEKIIFLGNNFNGYRPLDSAFDKTTNNYLWYIDRSDFDETKREWPVRAWFIKTHPSISVIQTLFLPPGPWVRTYGTFDELGCFSCGCSCYMNMKLYVAANRIFIKVWGEAVTKRHQGVYQLTEKDKTVTLSWKKIISGDVTSDLFFSTSGCELVYQSQNEIKLMNVCHAN